MHGYSSGHIFGMQRDEKKQFSVFFKSAGNATLGNVSNSKSKSGAQRALWIERHTFDALCLILHKK